MAKEMNRRFEFTEEKSDKLQEVTNGVDDPRLAALDQLFIADDADSVMQGIALLRSLDDSSLWSRFAKDLSLDRWGATKYSRIAVLWILAASGRLKTVQKLDLSGCVGLRDLTSLQGLSSLRTLDLSDCVDLVSLDGLTSCSALEEIVLSGCTRLASLDGIRGCQKLRAIEVYGSDRKSASSGLRVVVDLEALGMLPLDDSGRLPVKADEQGRDGLWGQSQRLAAQFVRLREHLGLPSLEAVYLREPSEEEQENAGWHCWVWDPEARQWYQDEEERPS